MKKTGKILIACILLGMIFMTPAFAVATPSPTKSTPTPTPNTAETTQILNNLNNEIASKVAQLKLVEKQGIIGTVTNVNNTQITLKDSEGNIHFVDVDELTVFTAASGDSAGISDITKNSTIGVLGLYNKDSRRILARFINVLTLPTFIHGAIAAIDRTNYTLTVVENDGKQVVVEIEDVTKTDSYTDSASGLTKSGFSKTQVGERVYVAGYPDKQNAKQLIAARILIFPSLPINPAIGTALPALTITPASTPSATPAK